jgi:Flp pilus assembly protein TadB
MGYVICFFNMLLALVWLAQSMARHGKQIWGKALPDPAELKRRRSGWLVLGLNFLLLWYVLGLALALLIWLGYATLASLIIAFVLSYQPRWLRLPGL